MALVFWAYKDDVPVFTHVTDYRPTLKSRVFADNGELIAEFGVDSRIMVPFSLIPKKLIGAFIAAEDKHFYEHHGIDFMGIMSSVVEFFTLKRDSLRGASTLTQQLAKSLLIKKEGFDKATARTISRKIKEAILALRLENILNKEEILWIYLNDVYLGHSSYGVAAAAKNYFRKELGELSLNEMALLAGLPQAPSRFSPMINLKASLARQAYVLARMREDGFIDNEEEQHALSNNKNLRVFPIKNTFKITAPYFCEHIRRELIDIYGEQRLYEDGLNIYTTLDLDREKIMQRVIRENLAAIDKRQGYDGPIFRPTNANEAKKAHALISMINSQDLFSLGPLYALAIVKNINHQEQHIVIDIGEQISVIPLSYMNWARKKNPTKNFLYNKLTTVKDVLEHDDVILVKKQETSVKNNPLLYSLEQEPKIEAAMIAIEPSSGYVHALNGGYSFFRSEFNRTMQACRQPGSVFKPIVYGAAIALKGYNPATIIEDAPLTFRDSGLKKSWKPKNFEKEYKGEVTVREAVMNSMNVPTLNVVSDVGLTNVIDWAHKMGIRSELKQELGTAIGSSCITPFELSRVFLTIANEGQLKEPIFIKEIKDRDHRRLLSQFDGHDPWIKRDDRISAAFDNVFQEKNQVMSKEDAFTLHYLLEQVATFGTAKRSNILKRQIAGKTGTTNDSFDTWFAGYSKELLSVVWVGNDTMEEPLGVYEQGGRTALPLFIDFISHTLQGISQKNFTRPASMCEARIDERSGLRIEQNHPQSFLAPFRCGHEPDLKPDLPYKNIEQALDLIGGL